MFLKILENYPGYSQNFPWKFSRFLLEILWIFNGNYLIFSLKCFSNTLEFHFSNFVFTVQPETCHLSITSYVNNNRQSEGLTSCLHSLYVETFSYFVNVKNQVRTIVLFCEKNKQFVYVLFVKLSEKNIRRMFLYCERKNKTFPEFYFLWKTKENNNSRNVFWGRGICHFLTNLLPKKKKKNSQDLFVGGRGKKSGGNFYNYFYIIFYRWIE